MGFLQLLDELEKRGLRPDSEVCRVLTWCLEIDLNSPVCSAFVESWPSLDKDLHDAFTNIRISYSVAKSQVLRGWQKSINALSLRKADRE